MKAYISQPAAKGDTGMPGNGIYSKKEGLYNMEAHFVQPSSKGDTGMPGNGILKMMKRLAIWRAIS